MGNLIKKSQGTRKVNRMVTISSDIDKRMRGLSSSHHVNWSAIAEAAFCKALEEFRDGGS